MPKHIAVVASDLHLQTQIWASRPEIRGDAIFAWNWIVDYATKLNLPLILAGDVLDKPRPEPAVIKSLRLGLAKLQKNGCPVYYIQGQPSHDQQDPPWVSAISKWATHLPGTSDRPVRLGPYRLFGVDWTSADKLAHRLSAVPADTDILVMHQVCDEFMGDVARPELCWSDVPYAKVLIVGDFHGSGRALNRANREGKPMLVVSPGSTCFQTIREPLPKKIFLLQDDLTVEAVTLPGRIRLTPPELVSKEQVSKFIRIVAERLAKAVDASTSLGLPEHLRTPVLVVRLGREVAHCSEQISHAVRGKCHLFLVEIVPPAAARVDDSRMRLVDERSALSACVEEGTELFSFCELLLSSTDVNAFLDDWIK